MTNRFLHIGFKWSGEPKTAELKPTFDNADDWLRYAPNCWIVWSSSGPETWFERLKPYLGSNDNVFICALDINTRQGWLPKNTWEWINKKRA